MWQEVLGLQLLHSLPPLSPQVPPVCLSFFARTQGLPQWLSGKESACSAGDKGDVGSIPGSGRCPGDGNGYPLQYSCLESGMDRGTWQDTVHVVAKSWDMTETAEHNG